MEENKLSQYLQYLPAIFHEDPFAGRFLLSFERILAGFNPLDPPLTFHNYEMEVNGAALQSSEGNQNYLKIDNVSIGMTAGRGLNTVILNRDGTFKDKAVHDVYGNAARWNNWADWIESTAADDDVVAVASNDAVRNAPVGSSAEKLLNAIDATEAFKVQKQHVRCPYALLFIKGQGGAREVSEKYKGPNARLSISYNDLLNIEGSITEPGLDQTLDNIHNYFDPRPGEENTQRAPTEFLSWLARWVALTLREDWDEEAKRRLISRIVPIYRKRGTKAGLQEILTVYTRENVKIYETEHPAHFFQVEMTLNEQNQSSLRLKEKIAKAIIDQEKPAHTFYALKILIPTMQIINNPKDENSGIRVGKNTLLGTTTL